MIKKVNGIIPLGNNEILDCNIEIEEHSTHIDEETMVHLLKMWQNARDIANRFQIGWQYVATICPTGPVVEGSIVERVEGNQ